jgi:chaperonin cofactor prefoldin
MLQGDEWKEIAESVGLDLSNELNNELENIIEDKPIKENINFIIKCKNSDELEQLQSKLNTSEQKINFKDFILKAAL